MNYNDRELDYVEAANQARWEHRLENDLYDARQDYLADEADAEEFDYGEGDFGYEVYDDDNYDYNDDDPYAYADEASNPF